MAPSLAPEPADLPPPNWFDLVNDAIFLADAAWQIQQWNRAAEQIYGWPRAEAIGRSIWDVIPVVRYFGDSSDELATLALRRDGIWRGEFVQRTRDGREVVIEGSSRAIQDAQGAIQGYIGINRDITARRAAEDALRASEERLRAIIENGVEGVGLVDASRQFRDISPSVTTLLGYPDSVFRTLTPEDLTHPEDWPALRDLMDMVFATPGATGRITVRTLHQDGSWRWIEQRSVNQMPNPAIAAIIISFRDVTEQVQNLQALQQAVNRLQVLTSASLAFASATTNYPALLELIAQIAGDRLRTGAVIRLISSDEQWLRLTTVYDPDPVAQASAQALIARAPTPISGSSLAAVVARSGEPLLMPVIDPEVLRAAMSAEERASFEHFRPHSMVLVPLHAHGRSIGTLSLIRHGSEQPAFNHNDLMLAQDLATRAALAISNAQLYQNAQAELERRRSAERSLLASEERFSVAFHASPVAFAITEADTGSYLAVNKSFQRLLGYSEVELIGQTSVGLGVYAGQGERATLQQMLVKDGVVHDYVLQLRTKSGEIRQTLISLTTITLDDTACFFTVLTDITDRVRVEQALAAEQARVIQLKNAFMATMSHELRTPLAAILGPADLLLDGAYGVLDEAQATAVQRIEESGRHLLDLVNDILDYTKFEAGQVAITRSPTPVIDLCQASINSVAQAAQLKQIVPIVAIDPDVALIEADGRRMRQILVNLLSNAVKFTPAGGEIGLGVRGDHTRSLVTFTVWDTGIGIDPANIARLFQPFSQIDNRLSREFEGTGLGLALVHQLVDAHGGGIAVESAPGAGSRFSVTLPWAGNSAEGRPLAAEPAGVAAQHTQRHARPERILIVEDHASNRIVLQEMIERNGFQALVARDGIEGLAAAAEHRPALILMDIQLPGMSGIEVIRRIRADATLHDIPIIAVTALAMMGDREQCMAAGANGYLTKPVSMAAMIEAIIALLPPLP
jgi:PAS domain S-box-containing protein